MPECELYSVEWCRRRKLPKWNIVELLRDRELGVRRSGSQLICGSREFYHCLDVTRSFRSAGRPQFFPLRFTPCGRRLIGLSATLREILIYDYCGVQMAMATPPDQIFSRLFKSCRMVRLAHSSTRNMVTGEIVSSNGVLHHDCCFITADSRYLIACTVAPIPESSSILSRIQQNNESLPTSSEVGLEDVRFYSIDLRTAEIKNRLHFDFDIIIINQGVYLLDRLFVILSVQHQTIHVYTIDRHTGEFIPNVQIGRTMFDNDHLYLKSRATPSFERCLTGFRQRFLTFLYKDSVKRNCVASFLRNFGYYRDLKMHKIQLVGSDHILIRMDTHFNYTSQTYLFVLLEWRVGRIVGVYGRSSRRLFEFFERRNEMFRAGTSGGLDNRFPTSPEYSWYARSQYEYVKSTRFSHSLEETRRQFLSCLPYSCVSVPAITPFLDPEMFTFDDRNLLYIERARVPVKEPFKVFSRRSNLAHVHLEFNSTPNSENSKDWQLRLIFHPTDPFAISVPRGFKQPNTLIVYHMPSSYSTAPYPC